MKKLKNQSRHTKNETLFFAFGQSFATCFFQKNMPRMRFIFFHARYGSLQVELPRDNVRELNERGYFAATEPRGKAARDAYEK